jgi:hypothetical protein
MALFPNVVTPPPYRAKARRELRHVALELEAERERMRSLSPGRGRASRARP